MNARAAMIATGLDRLLEDAERLRGRRYGLLAHAASVTADLQPIHLALAASVAGPPAALYGPEHGYYAVEQDMVAAESQTDPWTGAAIVSLYGDSADSLIPRPEAFAGLDVLVIDLQDVGARYYTYAATAVWAAEVALQQGREVWILDRPNPLGGSVVEGNLLQAGLESFVGAFHMPVRHGLTLAELVALEGRRRGWSEEGLRLWRMEGWQRSMTWPRTGRAWIAPSPNMPTFSTAQIYPGGCLIEATTLSEGRGTTRPFHLVGAPGIDPLAWIEELRSADPPGVAFLPTYFRPQFQKHAAEVCAGVEIVVTDGAALRPYRLGIELLAGLHRSQPEALTWRTAPYEFVTDRPALDLLTGSTAFRESLEGGESHAAWLESWAEDEAEFRRERAEVLLYPEEDR